MESIKLVFLFAFYHAVTSQNITQMEKTIKMLEKSTEDRESRLVALEMAFGQLLTGTNTTDISSIKVPRIKQGFLPSSISSVMFSAYKSFAESSVSDKVIVKFDAVYINNGNHFHTENGIFVAPVSGIYLFHWGIASGSNDFYVQLMVGGKFRASSYIPYSSGTDVGSSLVITEVDKNKHVWIQTMGSGIYIHGGGAKGLQSTFTGILLQQTKQN